MLSSYDMTDIWYIRVWSCVSCMCIWYRISRIGCVCSCKKTLLWVMIVGKVVPVCQPCSKVKTPAAQRAVYSPRERPAETWVLHIAALSQQSQQSPRFWCLDGLLPGTLGSHSHRTMCNSIPCAFLWPWNWRSSNPNNGACYCTRPVYCFRTWVSELFKA